MSANDNDMFAQEANPEESSSSDSSGEEAEEDFQIVKCDLCGKNFDSVMAIAVHKTLAHRDLLQAEAEEDLEKKKPHQCSFCEKRFASQGALRNHEDTHILPQRFKCETCGKGFNQKGNLKAHEMRHKPSEGAAPRARFPCQFCPKDFASKGSRLNHERMHTDNERFKCRFCQKGFNQKANMQAHERQHTAERPFKCEICDKAFASRPPLYTHRRTAHNISAGKKRKVESEADVQSGGNKDWDQSLIQGPQVSDASQQNSAAGVKEEVASSLQAPMGLGYVQHLQQSLQQHFNQNV